MQVAKKSVIAKADHKAATAHSERITTSISSIGWSAFQSSTNDGDAMTLPDNAEKSAIVASVRTFTVALEHLSLDRRTQERCLVASNDVMRVLQRLINRLNRT